ncbi:M20 family metallopeptidase [Evansella clarkii]|uniref:M20 family metallopeptidase n=1 Tax=Evansella clarkii TaxID=79879 RepID=UPI0009972E11|nr:M20/M25/M40 family metallo-hydrolase [Evansella clarkii]
MVDTISLLEEMIKIDSSTKEGANEAVEFCGNWLEKHGMPVEMLDNEGYKIAVCEIGEGDNTIVFNGHVDVVDAHPQQFNPKMENGKLYGRGSIDMKGGVASMMAAMVSLKDKDLSCKVQLQIVPDEETGGNYGTGYLTEQGYLGDFIICGEPTDYGIAVQSLGVIHLDVVTLGVAAHGSRPFLGENAIENAYKLYEKILKLPFTEEEAPPFYGSASVNLAKISAGTARNMVPDRCTMALDIRYLPTQSPNDIIRQIEEAVVDGEVHIVQVSDPITTKEDNPYVKALGKCVTAHTDQKEPRIYGQRGSSDGKFFTKHGGAPVEFGPVGKDWHGEQEMIDLSSVEVYQKILEDFVQSCSSSRD